MGIFQRSAGVAPERAIAVYGEILKATRREGFFRDCRVPDSLDGRFDILCIHAFLAMRRLKTIGSAESASLGQALFDTMFQDLDAALRQIGVSDVRIGKEVKKMAKAFLGRVQAYDAALTAADGVALDAALARNVYRGEADKACGEDDKAVVVLRLRRYMERADAALARQSDEVVLGGRFGFPDLEDDMVRLEQ